MAAAHLNVKKRRVNDIINVLTFLSSDAKNKENINTDEKKIFQKRNHHFTSKSTN